MLSKGGDMQAKKEYKKIFGRCDFVLLRIGGIANIKSWLHQLGNSLRRRSREPRGIAS